MFNDDIYPPPTAKDYVSHSQPLYVRQPYSLQIIQLVECSPPPPPQQQQKQKYSPSRVLSSSSSYSSSSSSPYSESDLDDSDGGSAYDSSSSSLSAGGSGCSSYCSSAEEVDNAQPALPPSFENRDPSIDDTYHTRQRRVSLWRDAVCSKDVGVPTTPISPTCTSSSATRPASPSQKRKTPDGDLANSDSVTSHTPPRKSTRSTLSAHSCPACDEDFSSPLSLRQHASQSRNPNEACRIAVEYGFE